MGPELSVRRQSRRRHHRHERHFPFSGVNPYVNIATPGSIVQPTWPVTNPFIYPVPGTIGIPGTSTPYVPDANENRPPRVNQFSFGVQRQITPNFIVEASYVANRAVWLQSLTTGFLSQTSAQTYAQFGLYPYPGTGRPLLFERWLLSQHDL